MKKRSNELATKKDIKKLNERVDFFHKDMTNSFKTVLEVIGDQIDRIDEVLKRIDEQGKRQDASLEELRSNRIVLGSHEQRLQKVEHKVFPQ